MKLNHLLPAFVILTAPHILLAHGEDKPGPHGGFIRMPGAFHTEVVPQANSFDLYLLDVNWKSPTTAASTVSAKIKNTSETPLSCKASGEKFICDLPKGLDLKKGELVITAKRGELAAGIASYPLPLKLVSIQDEHGGHH